jgi:cyclopropane fatty-acyl-phospholipid synthase-like methyltransferase
MGRLNDILIDLYSRHYARVSITFDDPQGTAEVLRDYETQFGDIVRALPAGSEVADLGCGIGMMVAWLATIPGVRPVGVDGSAAQIEIARKNLPPTVEVHCMQLEPFLRARPARFGAIFAINILEHIPGDDNVLALTEAVRDALVPGGVFVCSVPNAASLTSGYSRYMNLTHFRAFTTTSLLQLLEAAGLENCQIRPRRATDLPQAVRMWIEHWTHRVVYRLCGRSGERHFAKDLMGVGYREGV